MIVGGGSSTRFGTDKLMSDVHGRPLLEITVSRIAPLVDRCVLVVRPDSVDRVSALGLEASVTSGGSTRTLSEMAGLAVLGDSTDLIGIHDAARPLITEAMVNRLFEAADEVGGAVPVVDTDDLILDRKTHQPVLGLNRAQTPQVFRSDELLAAYVKAAEAGFDGHDTAEVVQRFTSLEIAAVPGDPANLKVTYPADLDVVRAAVRT